MWRVQSCGKAFNGKNALRNFELHAIFWLLYEAHPALRTPAALADPEVGREDLLLLDGRITD